MWVHDIYDEMLQLFSTFPPLPLYFNGRCFSNKYINTIIISNVPSQNSQCSFSVALVLCFSFSAFLLRARIARYTSAPNHIWYFTNQITSLVTYLDLY